jgi:HlyD family secretion protein
MSKKIALLPPIAETRVRGCSVLTWMLPASSGAGQLGSARKVFRLVLLTKSAVAAVAIAYFGLPSRVLAGEPSASSTSADMSVSVAQAKTTCFADMLQVTGVLIPRNELLVRPDREGLRISEVLVEPGNSVVAGQVLVRLTPLEGQPAGGTGLAVQAPAAGIVSSRSAIIGTLTSARAEPLFRITARGEMELLAETPAKNLASIALNQPAKIEIVGVGELSGMVRLVSTVINATTQLAQVRIFIGSDPRLRVGAFGRAKIDVGRRCGPAVPLSAVLYGSEGAVVQVVRDSRIETRRVSVGLLAAGQAEIRDGVSVGDVVVARAGSFVREGDRVRAVTATESSGRR